MIGGQRLKKHSTKLRPCAHCGFWLSPQQVYCPNCNQSQPFSLAFLPFKVLLFSTSTLGILTLFHQLEMELTWARFGVGLGEGLGITGGLFGSVWLGSKQWLGWSILPQKPQSCLQQDEARIYDRLHYLQERQHPIDQVRQRAAHIRDLQRRATILQALDHAVELLQTQVDQYQIKLWEIALLRWHNKIQPLLYSHSFQPAVNQKSLFHRLRSRLFGGSMSTTPAEVASALETLEEILTTGQALLVDWEHGSLSDRSEAVELRKRLEKALNSSDRLYQDLVALQTSIVLKGLSHFELDAHLNSPNNDGGNEAEVMLEAFSDLPSVSDFFQGFDALENEYLRLQGELEVCQLSSTFDSRSD
jgi:hypothetical protein